MDRYHSDSHSEGAVSKSSTLSTVKLDSSDEDDKIDCVSNVTSSRRQRSTNPEHEPNKCSLLPVNSSGRQSRSRSKSCPSSDAMVQSWNNASESTDFKINSNDPLGCLKQQQHKHCSISQFDESAPRSNANMEIRLSLLEMKVKNSSVSWCEFDLLGWLNLVVLKSDQIARRESSLPWLVAMLRGRKKTAATNAEDAVAVNKPATRTGGLATRSSNVTIPSTAAFESLPQKTHHPQRTNAALHDHRNVGVNENKNVAKVQKVLQTKEDAKKQKQSNLAAAEKIEKQHESESKTTAWSAARFDDVVLRCNIYADDIYDYIFHAEKKHGVPPAFLCGHTVTPKMRSILVDWLLQVHIRFHLLPETIFATINILDRYLAVGDADKSNLQLIGITCMSIASKYEEVYAPEMQDYVYITENSYSKHDIVLMEMKILSKIGVDLGRPHVIQFLRRISCYFDAVLHSMAKYICENAVFDYTTCHLKPSFIAAISLWLASRLEDRELPDDIFAIARVSEEEIQEWSAVFATSLLKTHTNTKLTALKNKYSNSKFSRVSDLLPNQVSILQKIAANRS
ncbi:unnamed protein product [Anisakis simplex]|uniref:Cyclin N-terminal domain-containing protein n=1 Tax=Anisakis simplex TaxID=6269 RepID=A0A158PNZ3_ANISI|nr:unnamed protein product [Anisakis simplex]